MKARHPQCQPAKARAKSNKQDKADNQRVRRQTIQYLDGQQRWDRAYQYLLQWTCLTQTPEALHAPPNQPTKEEQDEPAEN